MLDDHGCPVEMHVEEPYKYFHISTFTCLVVVRFNLLAGGCRI